MSGQFKKGSWLARLEGIHLFLRVLQLARPYWPLMAVAVLLVGPEVLLQVGIAWMQQYFIDTIAAGDAQALLLTLRWSGTAAAFLIAAICLGQYLRSYSSAGINRDIEQVTYDRVNRLPFAEVSRTHSGDLVSRVTADAPSAAGNTVGMSTYALVSNTVLCVVAFLYLSKLHLPLSLVVLASGPIVFLTGRFFDSRIRAVTRRQREKHAEVRGILQEILQGMAVIRAFNLSGVFLDKYLEHRAKERDLLKRQTFLNASLWQVTVLVNHALLILAAFLISLAAIHGYLTVGAVLAFTVLMGRVQWPFVGLSQTWGRVQQGLAAAERVFSILDSRPEDAGHPEQPLYPVKVNAPSGVPALEFRSVSFDHTPAKNGDEDAGLFTGLSFKVNPGETVALVGPSGAGKTTLARLSCGLYQPSAGEVLVFGRSTATDLNGARAYLAYVPQTPYLFAGTIEENIAYGRKDASPDEIREAAIAANAHEFIERLDGGYKAKVGEHGTSLSGGQRQRIALARAFLRQAPLIILDEATSALDNETEHLVQESMDRLMQGRTALVIAHRLSTIRNAQDPGGFTRADH